MSSLSVFAFMGLVLTQIILVTVRKNEAEATREWSVQKRIARAILVIVGVVGFVGLALFVIGYWGRYPGWWIMLPFGWLIGFAVIQGILQIRDLEPYVKPYFFATKRSYVLNGLVGLLGIALWSVVVTLMGIEGLAILNVFLVPISLSLLAVFGITMLLAKRRAKKHLAELE